MNPLPHAMPDRCCEPPSPDVAGYRPTLWAALGLNLVMFVVELVASERSGSVSLMADAIDFFGDAANYALSLAVLSMGLAARARASLVKAACMAAFGLFVFGRAGWNLVTGVTPDALTMGLVALLALVVNVGVAWMLYRYRGGDSNMRSVWLCSRNDALANIAVLLAALGIMGTGTGTPDLVVALGIAVLATTSAWSVGRQALGELRQSRSMPSAGSGTP